MRPDKSRRALQEILGKGIDAKRSGGDLIVAWEDVEDNTRTFIVKHSDIGNHSTVWERVDGKRKKTTASHLLTQAINVFRISDL